MTRHQVIGGDFFFLRLDLRASGHGEGTAGVEAATRGRIDGRRLVSWRWVFVFLLETGVAAVASFSGIGHNYLDNLS